jgi:phospholipid-binding lipoprotein MlaA
MSFGFLSAILLANGAAIQASDAVEQTLVAADERVVVLPGEPPLGQISASNAQPESSVTEDDADRVIVVTGEGSVPGDPMAELNAESFEVMQDIDQALVEPIAHAYRDDLPTPIRKGLTNFFRNLREPVVFLNFLLQLKPGKAAETLGRFAINSTVGIGGLVDVAKKEPFNLPFRRNGLANTLGYYGIGPGPFLYLPLFGATTVRDLLGGLADNAVLPTIVGKPFGRPEFGVPSYVVLSLDSRIEFDDELQRIRDADEPYTSMRETYLARRQCEIDELRGRAGPECRQ